MKGPQNTVSPCIHAANATYRRCLQFECALRRLSSWLSGDISILKRLPASWLSSCFFPFHNQYAESTNSQRYAKYQSDSKSCCSSDTSKSRPRYYYLPSVGSPFFIQFTAYISLFMPPEGTSSRKITLRGVCLQYIDAAFFPNTTQVILRQ